MELKELEKREDSSILFKLILEQEKIDELRNNVYKTMRPSVNIPGFRKGKVPIKTAEKMIGINNLYGKTFFEVFIRAVKDQGHYIYATLNPKLNEDFSMESIVYLYQMVQFTKNVNELIVTKQKPTVSKEEIEIGKKNIIAEFSTRVDVDEKYQASKDNGDEVHLIMTVENLDDKKIIAKDVEAQIILGLNDDGISNEIEGIRKNDKGVFSIKVLNKEYQYNVFCKNIQKLVPLSDEELLSKVKLESIEKMEQVIHDRILQKRHQLNEKRTFELLFSNLEKNSNFVLNNKLIDSLTKDISDPEQKKATVNMINSSYKQASLLVSAARDLKLYVTEDDIKNEVMKMKITGKINSTNVSDKLKIDIEQKLLEKKALDKLIKEE